MKKIGAKSTFSAKIMKTKKEILIGAKNSNYETLVKSNEARQMCVKLYGGLQIA